MRSIPRLPRKGVLILGLLVGAIGVLVAGHFVRIPGEKTVNQGSVSTYQAPPTSNQNTSPSPPTSSSTPPSPSDFTTTVPVYTPSQQVASSNTTASYTSPSPSYTVLNFYGEELSNNGWKILTETTANGTTTINARGNGYTMSVSIADSGQNGSAFTLQVA